jgi:predicted nucleic acid-binding protein
VRFGRAWQRSRKASGEAALKHGWKWNCKRVSRILPIDAAVADRWSLLAAAAKIRGKPLSAIDGLLAATAIHHNLTIVSRNVGDFTNTQTPVVNPWEP